MSEELDTDVNTGIGAPAWPTEIVEKIRADFFEQLSREHEGPFQWSGTMSERGPLVMSLVEGYAESHPAVAHDELAIANGLYAMEGCKR